MINRAIGLMLVCIIAPAVACTLGAAIYALVSNCAGNGCSGLFFTGGVMMGGLIGVFMGAPVALLIGLPLHFYLKRRGMALFAPYGFGGGLAGLICGALVGSTDWAPSPSMLAVGAVAGVFSAWLFWLMLRQPKTNLTTSEP